MNNLNDAEITVKVSDSVYSTSCSNGQSRESHSSKSTHSGSNSSGSSGYGGKPDTETSEYSSNDINQEQRIKDNEVKKKKKTLIEMQSTRGEKENEWSLAPVLEAPKDKDDARPCPFALAISESTKKCVDIYTSDTNNGNEGGAFSCVISLHDGVVVYAPLSVTTSLGYPKELWVGRSFIDFLHPKDRAIFASQIIKGLKLPKINNAPQVKAHSQEEIPCSIICRVRLFKDFTTGGFEVKNRAVGFVPYLLKFFLKNISNGNGADMYLVTMAIPFFSAYKTPNEIVTCPKPFIIKHTVNGHIEHIDIDAVRYLGYLPQEILEKDALQLYYPRDLILIRHIYENIVKNGFVPRSKPYRMMTQNGHYLILESEWSSLVNPWSKRLELIIGKHYILEGPLNPDVFQPPDLNNVLNLSEEEKTITMALRQSIIRVMNTNLTIPAQVLKQQIDKRNQDITKFLDQFIESKPKPEGELRVEIQDMDNCCFERDSVMLGGISPNHDNDRKSGTETPLSYNQLNYNENLERFFNSCEPYEECYLDSGSGIWKGKKKSNADSNMLSSLDNCSTMDNLSDSSAVNRISSTNEDTSDESDQFRLTKHLLQKHDADMEKELVKIYYKNRITSKSEREKAIRDELQKKLEHFARCNAVYIPTNPELSPSVTQTQGVKRSSKPNSQGSANKQRCPSPQINRNPSSNFSNAPIDRLHLTEPGVHHAIGMTPTWQRITDNNANACVLGVPQPISVMSPIPMQGVIPVYFAPLSHPAAAGNGGSNVNTLQFQAVANPNTPYMHGPINQPSTSTGVPFDAPPTEEFSLVQHAIPCMMIGHTIYRSPIIYPAIKTYASQIPNVHNIELSNKNYEEACKIFSLKNGETKRPKLESLKENAGESFNISFSSTITMDWTSIRVPQDRASRKIRRCESEKETTRTDGESNYSSFYSSFFKTESSSTTDDGDVRNKTPNSKSFCRKKRRINSSLCDLIAVQPNISQPQKDNAKEQVLISPEIINKYQIVTKNMEEVLANDLKKLQSFQQPPLVKQQLNQLYLDLQLQGVTARLTLEEGLTSSSSSGEDTRSKTNKLRRRKQRYNELVIIHEENAPLPSPDESSSSVS